MYTSLDISDLGDNAFTATASPLQFPLKTLDVRTPPKEAPRSTDKSMLRMTEAFVGGTAVED
jgi:hypothetical protein